LYDSTKNNRQINVPNTIGTELNKKRLYQKSTKTIAKNLPLNNKKQSPKTQVQTTTPQQGDKRRSEYSNCTNKKQLPKTIGPRPQVCNTSKPQTDHSTGKQPEEHTSHHYLVKTLKITLVIATLRCCGDRAFFKELQLLGLSLEEGLFPAQLLVH
jgi:hypothetical protein